MTSPPESPDDASLATSSSPPLSDQDPARRRRRRSHKARHRHRDLTPEEDNRRRQRRAILLIMPVILAVLGVVVWLAGQWNLDEYQHSTKLTHTGQWFVGIGGGSLLVLLLREWFVKIRANIKERLNRPMNTDRTSHGRRSHRRRHRSPKPSAVRVK